MSALPFIGPAINAVSKILDKIVPDAGKRDELKAELAKQVEQGNLDVELASINAVNQTMQAEAKSEHWAQWAWRPTIGFTFAAVILNNFVLLPYLQPHVVAIAIPAEVWTAMLVVLGASAATRGWEKAVKAGGK